MSVIPWSEIELFHNIRKYTQAYPDILNGQPQVSYLSKVKLHGANCAIQIHPDGSVACQSRTTILTPTEDFNGFAKWVEANKEQWQTLQSGHTTLVFGEWCGRGLNKSDVAVNKVEEKFFAVFAIVFISANDDKMLIADPIDIQAALPLSIPNLHVLPWSDFPEITIDWSAEDAELKSSTDQISQWVAQVEKQDPWMVKTFGIDGMGEGLVFYPQSHHGLKSFQNLAFKAKGEKHQVIKTTQPAQVNPETAANAEGFVTLVLPEARLEQGVGVIGADVKLTGKFVAWVWADVQKETQAELEASNLTWKDVQKGIETKARSWFLAKVKK